MAQFDRQDFLTRRWAVMFLPARGSGGGAASAVSRGWHHTVLWRLGGFLLLLLLEGARCLTNPSNAPGINNNNRPNVNVFMSEEEVKKLLGVYSLFSRLLHFISALSKVLVRTRTFCHTVKETYFLLFSLFKL